MDTVQAAVAAIAGAERAIVALASDSAQQGGYDKATVLIELARELKRLAADAEQQLSNNSTIKASVVTAPQDINREPTQQSSPQRSLGKGRRKKSEYPRFVREGQTLVKVGWSRSDKAEYEHKCPKDVVGRLSSAISRVGAGGKRFSMDVAMPHTNRDDGSETPIYQLYLALAWFRATGLIVQHGRQGYSLATKSSLEPLLNKQWDALPSR